MNGLPKVDLSGYTGHSTNVLQNGVFDIHTSYNAIDPGSFSQQLWSHRHQPKRFLYDEVKARGQLIHEEKGGIIMFEPANSHYTVYKEIEFEEPMGEGHGSIDWIRSSSNPKPTHTVVMWEIHHSSPDVLKARESLRAPIMQDFSANVGTVNSIDWSTLAQPHSIYVKNKVDPV